MFLRQYNCSFTVGTAYDSNRCVNGLVQFLLAQPVFDLLLPISDTLLRLLQAAMVRAMSAPEEVHIVSLLPDFQL